MNINTARKLHERRFRACPIMTTGELLNLIGRDGIQEALQSRWIVPDNETGMLSINMDGGKMQELESACKCPSCSKTECACPAIQEAAVSMHEDFRGIGLSSPTSSAAPTSNPTPMLPRPAAASPVSEPKNAAPQIGDEAIVADQGRDYTGRIASVDQDGRMRLSFGNEKPTMDRAYGPNELRVTAPATQHA